MLLTSPVRKTVLPQKDSLTPNIANAQILFKLAVGFYDADV